MSKRIVELNCGDPKTNQQTASKVECVINVNNQIKQPPKLRSSVTVEDATDCFDTSSEQSKPHVTVVKNSKSVNGDAHRLRDIPATGSVSSLYVARTIQSDEPPKPTTAEGYIQTASRPTITEVEIMSSSAVKDVVLQAFNNLLTTNDTALMAQLMAAKKLDERRVVLMLPDLKLLIGTVVRLVDPEFKDEDIHIRTIVNDVDVGCCGASPKTLVNPFNEINSISIGNQDLKIHQFEAFNTIEQKLNVSLLYVYSIIPDKVTNDETIIEP